jgi:hypothetical protein
MFKRFQAETRDAMKNYSGRKLHRQTVYCSSVGPSLMRFNVDELVKRVKRRILRIL